MIEALNSKRYIQDKQRQTFSRGFIDENKQGLNCFCWQWPSSMVKFISHDRGRDSAKIAMCQDLLHVEDETPRLWARYKKIGSNTSVSHVFSIVFEVGDMQFKFIFCYFSAQVYLKTAVIIKIHWRVWDLELFLSDTLGLKWTF